MNGTLSATYQYNDQGIRVRANTGSTKYYLIDSHNQTGYAQVLEELSTLGITPTVSYVIGQDVLGQCGTSTTDPRWFLHDGHGSNRQLVDKNSGVTSHYGYEAYGLTQYGSTSTAETRMLYCGEQYDSTLQMYNLRARYYNATNGRFNQRDAFAGRSEDPQSLHKYTYTNCDPMNCVDPDGRFSVLELLVAILVITVIVVALLPTLNRALYKSKVTRFKSDARNMILARAQTQADINVMDQGTLVDQVNVGGTRLAPAYPMPWTDQAGTWMGWEGWSAYRRNTKSGPPVLFVNVHPASPEDPAPSSVEYLIGFARQDPDFDDLTNRGVPSHWYCVYVGTQAMSDKTWNVANDINGSLGSFTAGKYYNIPLDVIPSNGNGGSGLAIVPTGIATEISKPNF